MKDYVLKIKLVTDKKDVNGELKSVGKNFETLGKSLSTLSENLKKMITVPALEAEPAIAELNNSFGEINDTATQMSEGIGEAFNDLPSIMGGFNTIFEGLSPAMQEIVVNTLVISSTFLGEIGPMITMVGSLLQIFGALGSLLPLLLSPVGLIVAAIVALGIAFGIAMVKSQTFRNGVLALGANIASFISSLSANFTLALAVATAIFKAIKQYISNTITSIALKVVTLSGTVSGVFNSIWTIISSILTKVSAVVTFIFSNIRQFINNSITSIGLKITTLSGTVSGVFNSIWSIVSSIMNRVSNTISTVFSAITTSWTGLKTFISGVFTGIGNNMQTLVSRVKGFVNGVIGGINTAIGLINKIPGVSISRIPQLQRGTDNWAGGFARMNEGGRGELVHLPNGSQVIPHDVSMRYAREAGRMSSNNFSFDKQDAFNNTNKNEIFELHVSIPLDGRELVKRTIRFTAEELGKMKGSSSKGVYG
ncbi:phage tail protein [Sutcliffiella rhizosphaerae]|uniref:Phage tail tape measure protein n=1 Tax=Sutcliffiella rhizosphaerae TaxID=2880967 RepID=A0ABM8YMX1_9BACI|nr:hypothetical protein [Sutcliffiella rhizosphaerae]CAG9621090.1 hypothetical protein BACCIP111883_01862 [Sutcliffiella rhizosphaerae]